MDTVCKNILEKCGNNVFYEYVKNNNLPMLLLEIDSKKIVYANIRAIEFYKYKIEELLSLKINDINILNKDVIEKKMEMAVKSLTNKYEFKHKIATGEIKDVQVFSNVIEVESEKFLLISVLDITEKKKKEKELFDKQLMIKDGQKIANLGFWERDINNDKYFWSDQIYEIYELDKSITKPNYRNFIKLIHPDERPKFFKIIKETALADFQILEIETKLLLHQTKIKYINLSFHRELDDNRKINRIFGTVQDISITKKYELKLQNQNNELELLQQELSLKNELLETRKKRYQTLYKNNPISLWEVDYSDILKTFEETKETDDFNEFFNNNPSYLFKFVSKINITNINEATKKLFHVDKKDELSAYLTKNFNKKTIRTFANILNSLKNGRSEFFEESEYILNNRKILPVKVHIKFIIEESIAIVSITDITEVKRIQRELTLAKENAVRSNNLKSEFLHNLSHEIRTPMNGIIGFSDILLEEDISKDKAKQYLNIIKNSANQLLTIIDDILEISKLETKHVKTANEEVCTNCVLLELFSIFDIKAKENKTPLYLNTQISEMQSTIYSDKSKIIKIVSNLLDNALKYTSEGSIEVGNYIEEKDKNKKYLHIYVKDTGIGIKKENIQTIFKRFSREKKHLSNSVSGLGLGLSIAKENAELLGGVLTVKSIENQGATFFLTIPYKEVYSEEENIEFVEENKDENKLTILIAEDEEVNFLFTKILIQQKLLIDCKIIHVINGLEALNMIKKDKNINLVLMDLKMPEMNGFESTSKIRKINSKVPIIAISAYSSEEDTNKALNAGCNFYISKPIDKNVFKKIIDKVISDIKNK